MAEMSINDVSDLTWHFIRDCIRYTSTEWRARILLEPVIFLLVSSVGLVPWIAMFTKPSESSPSRNSPLYGTPYF